MQENRPPVTVWTIPLAFAAIYAGWMWLGLGNLYYAPEARQVFLHKPEGVILMGWYGHTLIALAGSIVLGLVTAGQVRRLPDFLQRLGPWIATIVVIAAMVWTAIYEIGRWML